MCAAVAFGQYNRAHRFSWQEYCFTNPSSIVCQGHEYFKKGPKDKQANGTSGVLAPESIDWSFADPGSDLLIGFHPGNLAASPLERKLLVQLAGQRNLGESDVANLLDRLSGVDEAAIAIRGDRMVALLLMRDAGFTIPSPGEGMKAVQASAKLILVGHNDAVDQAVKRLATDSAPDELVRAAEDRQGQSDFWIAGPADLASPQAADAGVKRFALTISAKNRIAVDLALEFTLAPNASTLRTLLPTLGAVMIDSNTVHVHLPLEEISASPIGQRLPDLVTAARYLPVPAAPKQEQARPPAAGDVPATK